MRFPLLLAALFFITGFASAATVVQPAEMQRRDDWVKSAFEKRQPGAAPAGLLVVANHDPIGRNSRGNGPLHLGKTEYRRGIYCHATSKIVVYLPSPGKSFSATVGIDSNDQTSGGRGSVVFSVNAASKELFKSPVLREGMPGVPVDVDLKGATSFTLDVSDAGDGISCDQSDWADAKVILADGKELLLGDLPLLTTPAGLPFSFIYNGQHSSAFLSSWTREDQPPAADGARALQTITWTDPATGLQLRCQRVHYRDFPTVEWTLYFKNTSAKDTPILSQIRPMDLTMSLPNQNLTLHHHAGSQANSDDYRPLRTSLRPGSIARFATSGGRGSDGVWPYFNFEWPGGGLIAVIGWPGQWAATFAQDNSKILQLAAGQEKTHLKLLPNEEIRTPLIVLQFYEGDHIRAQNVWRRWMIAHNLPRLDGKLPPPLLAASSGAQCNEMQNANEQNQKQFIDAYVDNGVQLSFWWMDAGWYPFKDGWWNVGTWEPDRKRFPNGLRAISDHAHSRGVKTLLWFEPERVTPGTWLYENKPQWLLGADGGQKLFDLGNAEARQWLVEHVDRTMQQEGIDIYRQDFNFPPLGYWRGNDAPDRQGITEIKHVTGYLAYWDELRRRHPGLLIDTCASGGRRNDLETLRRSVPLHKSDMDYPNLTAKQTQFYGLAMWEPFFGAAAYPVERVDVYGFRCGMALLTGVGYDIRRKDIDYALLRKLVGQWRQIAPMFWGDYYPLTAWSFEEDVWMAWQLDCPEEQRGMVQAFRRPASPYETARFHLRGLDPAARYRVRNLDDQQTADFTGKQLMDEGLLFSLPIRPAAGVVIYEQVK